MRIRIRIPDLEAGALDALGRQVRLSLGRHAASIESVEVRMLERERAPLPRPECEVAVTLREGGAIRVHDDGSQLERALGRAAWRIDQRRERRRLRGPAADATRSSS